jgi:hypothetical protein
MRVSEPSSRVGDAQGRNFLPQSLWLIKVKSAMAFTRVSSTIEWASSMLHLASSQRYLQGFLLIPSFHLNRWLYSTCGKCEICDVNPTSCPNQHNSGRVSFLEARECLPLTCFVNNRTSQALFNASSRLLHRIAMQFPLIRTAAEYMVSPAEHLTQIPEQLESTLVAPLLCGTPHIHLLFTISTNLRGSWIDGLFCVSKSQS